jgi:hypothetical protein
MKLFIRDKVYFTDPTTGEFFEDTITHVDEQVIMGRDRDLTSIYNRGDLNIYRIQCYVCGCIIPKPLSQFQVDGLKGKQQLLPSTCNVCLTDPRYYEDPEEGIILFI